MFSVLDEFCVQPRSKSPHEEAKTAQWGGEGGHTPPPSPLQAIEQVKGILLAFQDLQREGSLTHLLLPSSAFHSQAWPLQPSHPTSHA